MPTLQLTVSQCPWVLPHQHSAHKGVMGSRNHESNDLLYLARLFTTQFDMTVVRNHLIFPPSQNPQRTHACTHTHLSKKTPPPPNKSPPRNKLLSLNHTCTQGSSSVFKAQQNEPTQPQSCYICLLRSNCFYQLSLSTPSQHNTAVKWVLSHGKVRDD
jgi:hypothetical protein